MIAWLINRIAKQAEKLLKMQRITHAWLRSIRWQWRRMNMDLYIHLAAF